MTLPHVHASRIVADLAVKSGARRVIDLRCGAGRQLHDLAKRGLGVVGAESCKTMLNVARRRLHGVEQANVVLASSPALPFADNSFDLGILSFALHGNGGDCTQLVDEGLRLAPRLFILDWAMPERNLDYPAHFFLRMSALLPSGRRHSYACFKKYMRGGALEGLLGRYCQGRGACITWREHMCLNTMLLMQVERT